MGYYLKGGGFNCHPALVEKRKKTIEKYRNNVSWSANIQSELKEATRELPPLPAEQTEAPTEIYTAVAEKEKDSSAQESPKAAAEQKIVLEKHSGKSWFKAAVLGVFIGLAVVVPGISGATISIIFKLYDKLVFAISDLLKHFKRAFLWLLPVALGIVLGFVAGFFGVQEALNYIPFAVVCLFAGLMIGALPAVFKEIKGAKKTPWRLTLLALGFIIPIAVSAGITVFVKDTGNPLATIEWWEYVAMFFAGAVVALTQIIPGLSASSFMMMIGYFTSIMNSISLTYWKANPAVFGIYGALVLGFIVGLLAFSKALSVLLTKKREPSFFAIVGLSLGSIVTMFFNPEINETYLRWQGQGTPLETAVGMNLDLGLGAGLLVVGIIVSAALVVYQARRDRKLQAQLSLKD